ncbi:MAG: hypothetical protein H6601_11425 [Flavobacteriales bacterium]|nr:hypothetical protein [Flavobacteriales bacterium]MCB9205619.1 hypothetical protein [Flavobacteriales bacterium]
MFNREDLNKPNDYTFAFLEAKKSNGLLDKFSPHCGENSDFNSVRGAYTITNPCKSVRSVSSVFQ